MTWSYTDGTNLRTKVNWVGQGGAVGRRTQKGKALWKGKIIWKD
jgi:hypothetical protein